MKVYKFNIFFMLFCLAVIISCSKKESYQLKDDSDIRYRYYNLERMGWKSKNHKQQVKNITYEATEVPIQYYLLKDMGNSDLITVDSIYEENKKERVIEFTFQDDEERDLLDEKFTKLDYKKSVEYMSFTIQNDFMVVTSKKDTVLCSGVLFERNFKVAPYNKVLLFFSGIDPNDNIQLIYKDNLFQNGVLKFQFKEPIVIL
ncbi:MAG: hypothetical protein DCF13_13490 [Flavobacteriaceae bacterium]|nr:MAG: hypothetical protein DCF13_13490 [Flavobacteriaceae bacterium]